MITNKKRSKLGATLAVIAGVGCAAPAANAAMVFTANDNNPAIFAALQARLGLSFGPEVRGVQVFDPANPGLVLTNLIFSDATGGPGNNVGILYGPTGGIATSSFGQSFGNEIVIGITDETLNTTDPVTGLGVIDFQFDDVLGGFGVSNFVFADFNFDGEIDGLIDFAFVRSDTGGVNLSIAGIAADASINAGDFLIVNDSSPIDLRDAFNPVPEPSSLVLVNLGVMGLLMRRRRNAVA